jgi:hypothetical protein
MPLHRKPAAFLALFEAVALAARKNASRSWRQ